MADHLQLPQPLRNTTRRSRGGRGSAPPERESFGNHARALRSALEAPPVRPDELVGIDPDLVFKFRGAGQLSESSLRGQDLEVLGENDDWTYFVLLSDDARGQFLQTLTRYGTSDSRSSFDGTKSLHDSLTTVDAIEPYGPRDRLDPELADIDSFPTEVVVRIWPSGTTRQARDRIQLLRSVIETDPQSQVLAEDSDPESTIVVSSVTGSTLDLLAQTSVVERVSPPLSMTVSNQQVAEWSLPDGAVPLPQGEPIGVLDDGFLLGNVLLEGVVTDAGSFPSSKPTWQPPRGHGMNVSSLAAFFDFEQAVRYGGPLAAPHPVLLARVVEPNPERPGSVRQPSGHVFEQSVEEAIRALVEQGARVVNMSINEEYAAAAGALPSPLTLTLDRLAREFDLVIVISAGNIAPRDISAKHVLGQHAALDYPNYLRDPGAAIAHPGLAANAVTVASVAHFDEATLNGYRAIAPTGSPSPFTRTGISSSSARPHKPDLAHWGGNWAWNDYLGTVHRADPSISTVVASTSGDSLLEPGHYGTSFSAPRVAFIGAEVRTKYPSASANLVRALMALSAVPSTGDAEHDRDRNVVGWGIPGVERATGSGDNRAVLMADGEVVCDATDVHRIPIPEEYASGRSRRRITVALAFDPPVRRQRHEYTAGVMSLVLVRAVDAVEALEIFRKQPTKAQRDADPTLPHQSLPSNRRRLALTPSTPDLGRSTLIRAEWTGVELQPDDGDEYFLAVSHHKSNWTGLGDYTSQRYGLAVELVDEGRTDLPLYQLVQARLQAQASAQQRLRLRA